MPKTMQRTVLTVLSLLLVLGSLHAAEILPGKMVVKFKDPQLRATTLAELNPLTAAPAFPHFSSRHPLARIYTLTFPESTDIETLTGRLATDANIEYAEPLYVHHTYRLSQPADLRQCRPNDEYANLDPEDPEYQWALDKMEMFEAWCTTTGDPNVLIAIIDTGMDMDHPDLVDQYYVNPNEIENGIDDDQNGLVDDLTGWDLVDGDNNPQGTATHGTMVGGIASAVTNNSIGIAGIGYSCALLPIRAGQSTDITFGYQGILYAAVMGADIINCSWGRSGRYSHFENDILQTVTEMGSLVIAAAGNEGTDALHWPAAYENVLSVGNTNENDVLVSNSNYGTWLDVCAPGASIRTTHVNGGYTTSGGTSLAAPQVAGLAGLVKSLHPDWTPQQIAAQIIATADPIDSFNLEQLAGKLGSGRVNGRRAVTETTEFVRYEHYQINDPDGDGVVERNELEQSLELAVTLRSLLSDVPNVTGTLTTNDEFVSITDGSATFGTLVQNQLQSNDADPFQIVASVTTPNHHRVEFELEITADGGFHTTDRFAIYLKPSYRQHRVGAIDCAVSDRGVSGWGYLASNDLEVIGMRYPQDRPWDFGFGGSLVVGASVDWMAEGYGNNTSDPNAWTTTADGSLILSSSEQADESGIAVYEAESAAGESYRVTQTTFAWADAPNNDFVIYRFRLRNTGEHPLTNVHAGYFWDFDVPGDIYGFSENLADFDEALDVGYAYHATRDTLPYAGLQLLSETAYAFRVISNSTDVYPTGDISDRKLYEYLGVNEPIIQSQPMDLSLLLGVAPFDLAVGEAKDLAFAFLAGDDLADLQANAQAAREIYSTLTIPDLVVTPESYDFGVVPVGENRTATFTLRNEGTADLTIDQITITGTHATAFELTRGGNTTLLTPNQSAELDVQFSPIQSGMHNAQVVIQVGNSSEAILLGGIGLSENEAVLQIEPEQLDFGAVLLGTTVTKQLVLTNAGNTDLSIQKMTIRGANFRDFELVSPQTWIISPNLSATITLEFTPQTEGSKSALLEITSNAFSSPDEVNLSGDVAIFEGPCPNPHSRTEHGARPVIFEYLDAASTVQLFTLDGDLVREAGPADIDTGLTCDGQSSLVWKWDTTNANGTPVAPGVYVYVISVSGTIKTGKVAILR